MKITKVIEGRKPTAYEIMLNRALIKKDYKRARHYAYCININKYVRSKENLYVKYNKYEN